MVDSTWQNIFLEPSLLSNFNYFNKALFESSFIFQTLFIPSRILKWEGNPRSSPVEIRKRLDYKIRNALISLRYAPLLCRKYKRQEQRSRVHIQSRKLRFMKIVSYAMNCTWKLLKKLITSYTVIQNCTAIFHSPEMYHNWKCFPSHFQNREWCFNNNLNIFYFSS